MYLMLHKINIIQNVTGNLTFSCIEIYMYAPRIDYVKNTRQMYSSVSIDKTNNKDTFTKLIRNNLS